MRTGGFTGSGVCPGQERVPRRPPQAPGEQDASPVPGNPWEGTPGAGSPTMHKGLEPPLLPPHQTGGPQPGCLEKRKHHSPPWPSSRAVVLSQGAGLPGTLGDVRRQGWLS